MTKGASHLPVAAVSGTATLTALMGPVIQFTVVPGTASGTGAVTVMPVSGTGVEPAHEPVLMDGVAMTIDLSAQVTHRIECDAQELKVDSDNNSDTFSLIVA